jgi:hypothetical protein
MHLNCAIPSLLTHGPKHNNSFATLPHTCSFLKIRKWRESTGGLMINLVNNSQRTHDPIPSPTTSARKRQKMSQPILSACVPAPSAMHSQPLTAPMQPSSSGAKKGAQPGTKVKKTKPVSDG